LLTKFQNHRCPRKSAFGDFQHFIFQYHDLPMRSFNCSASVIGRTLAYNRSPIRVKAFLIKCQGRVLHLCLDRLGIDF
jgi:hypothetical protein